jgi:hypothetical protein
MYQMIGGMKAIPLVRPQQQQPMVSYGCCPTPHCDTCGAKPKAKKAAAAVQEEAPKQSIAAVETPKQSTVTFYDTRQSPTLPKIGYAESQKPKQEQAAGQMYARDNQQHQATPKAAQSPKEIYASSAQLPKISATSSTLPIADIADRVASSYGKGSNYAAKTEPKTEMPKRDLFSVFKAYATAVGAALSIAAPTAAMPSASYTKLEQSVAHVAINTGATKHSSIDGYLSHSLQTQPIQLQQSASAQPKISLTLTLEGYVSMAAQKAPQATAAPTTQTAAIPKTNDANFYRMLPMLFIQAKKKSEGEPQPEVQKEAHYSAPYSREEKTYHTEQSTEAKKAPKHRNEEQKEKTMIENPVQTAKGEAPANAEKKRTAPKAKDRKFPALAATRKIEMERAHAEISSIRLPTLPFVPSAIGLNLGKS